MSDSTQPISTQVIASDEADTVVNELFEAASPALIFGRKPETTTGLSWGMYGGAWGPGTTPDAVLALTASATNYVVVERATGIISVSTSSTNYDNTTDYAIAWLLIADASTVTFSGDSRMLAGGTHAAGAGGASAPAGIPQNSKSANYTLLLADANKHIYHPSADATARTFTIPANSSVAYDIGTAITFVNDDSAGVITIAITTDTMRLAGAGTTGSRTLAANGIATALKITATSWLISGVGLT